VRAVVFGGLLDALAGVYVDCSTVSPTLATELVDTVGQERFASAPILGSPALVGTGQATILVGGAGQVVERVRPALTSVSERIRIYPEPRSALVAKLVTNLVLLDAVAALAEAFAVGRAGGLSDDDMRALLGESPMVAPGLKNRFEAVLTGERDPWWASGLGAKDAGLAVDIAGSLPVTAAVRDRYLAVAALDLPDDDIAAVGELYGL
jgi:3-hydroxyisobutyrate dehydrogenase